MEEDSLEQKQQYLRENILEKGYDPNKFSEFLTMKMGETGTDLANWPLNELYEATNEFIKIEKENEQKRVNENNVEKEEEIKEEKEIQKTELDNDKQNEEKGNIINEEKPNKILIEEKKEEKEENKIEEKPNDIIIKDDIPEKVIEQNENKNKSIKCLSIDNTPISKEKEITIIVSEPKVEKNGIFASSYSTYLISTSPLNLKVRRKFDDFVWLYDHLKSRFTNCVVPPLFKRKDNVDINKMNERIYYIEKFLNGICQNQILKNSKIFYSLLSTKNQKEFIKIKAQYDKAQPPSEIENLKSVKGELNISISTKNETYFNNIKSKLNSQEALYNDLFNHYKNLLNNFSQVSKEMNEVSNIWKQLFNLQCKKMESNLFKFHSQIMDGWNELQKNNIRLIESLDKYFKFINEEYNNFKDLAKTVENNKHNFIKSKQKLEKAQANPLTKNKDVDDELKIKREENKLKKDKNEYGCYLNIYIDEYERICELNNTRFKKNIAEFIKDLRKSHKIISTVVKSENNFFDCKFPQKFILALGSEAFGLSDKILNMTDVDTTIEMDNNVESLNLAVCASIAFAMAKNKLN